MTTHAGAIASRKLPKKPKGRPLKNVGLHPVQRPCPPWCWHMTDNPDGFLHDDGDVEPGAPFEVTYTTHRFYSVTASLYGADLQRGQGVETVVPATIELNLRQVGQREPFIDVAVRHYVYVPGKGTQQRYAGEGLQLSLEDARELVRCCNTSSN